MFFVDHGAFDAENRFPRVRGDVPSSGFAADNHDPFSPRARGCS